MLSAHAKFNSLARSRARVQICGRGYVHVTRLRTYVRVAL